MCRALIAEGKAEWASKDCTVVLVTLQPVKQWADTILTVVRTRFTTSIVMVEELHSGEDAHGTGVYHAQPRPWLHSPRGRPAPRQPCTTPNHAPRPAKQLCRRARMPERVLRIASRDRSCGWRRTAAPHQQKCVWVERWQIATLVAFQ